MPELDLPPLHLPEAGLYLSAVMFFPRGEAEQHRRFVEGLHNSVLRKVLAKWPEQEPLPQAMLPLVRAAAIGPRADEVSPNAAAIVNSRNGQPRHLLAGLLLVHTLSQGEGGTLERAVTAFCTAGGAKASVPGRSRQGVMKAWGEFSPAAHLLAALLFNHDLWQARASGRHAGSLLALFLARADQLRVAAETYRAPRASRSLLDPAETWKVPPRVVLPEISPLSTLLPKTDQLEAALRQPASGPPSFGLVHRA